MTDPHFGIVRKELALFREPAPYKALLIGAHTVDRRTHVSPDEFHVPSEAGTDGGTGNLAGIGTCDVLVRLERTLVGR